eukprot:COSAG06_NODE_2854_length_6170_cov_10.221216_3_plen_125_part_00
MTFHGRSLSTLSTVVKDLEGMWPQDIKAVVEEVLKGRQFEGALAIPEPSLRMGKETRLFLSHSYIKMLPFYQDRLGTNIGKTQKKSGVSLGKLRITVGFGDQTAAPPVKPHPTMLAAHKRGAEF